MMQSFINWLLDVLRRLFDPDYAKRKKDYEEARSRVETDEANAQIDITNAEKERTNTEKEAAQVTEEVRREKEIAAALESQIETVKDEQRKSTEDNDNRSDADVLRGDL